MTAVTGPIESPLPQPADPPVHKGLYYCSTRIRIIGLHIVVNDRPCKPIGHSLICGSICFYDSLRFSHRRIRAHLATTRLTLSAVNAWGLWSNPGRNNSPAHTDHTTYPA